MACDTNTLMAAAAANGYYGLEARSLKQAILYMLCTNSSGGGGGGLAPGVVDPEGVVVGDAGQTYFNTANNTYWVKASGTGNTGWTQLI